MANRNLATDNDAGHASGRMRACQILDIRPRANPNRPYITAKYDPKPYRSAFLNLHITDDRRIRRHPDAGMNFGNMLLKRKNQGHGYLPLSLMAHR
jgi:hypothetical protein